MSTPDFTTGVRRVGLEEMADAVQSGDVFELSLLWLPNAHGRSLFGRLLEKRPDGIEALIAFNAFEDLEAGAAWLAGQGIDSAYLLIEGGNASASS